MVMAMALLAISSGIKGRPSKVKTRFKALSKVPEMGARNPPRSARFGGRSAMGRAAVAAAGAAAAEAQRGGVRGGQRDIRVAFQRRPPAGGSGKKRSELQDQQDEMEEEDQQPRQQQQQQQQQQEEEELLAMEVEEQNGEEKKQEKHDSDHLYEGAHDDSTAGGALGTDDVCEAGGVEEIIAAKWVAEETIWVVRNFVAEGESENTYNPRMCPWVGKVVDYDEDEDCATPYHVSYVNDGDEEWLSAEEVYNHRISAERATLLRGAVSANKDSGKCSVTSADLKMRATLSTRAGYDPTHSAVTHKDEGNKYHGTAGIVIKVEGTKKGRTITVRWADGVERPYTTKQLERGGQR